MAITIPIVSEFRDAGLKKAETEIQGFGKRAGAALKNVSATQLAAAGAAVAAFGLKAADSFTKGALGAAKFADATGLAIEDASRWISVAGDIGIEAGTIQSAFQRMNLAIAQGKPVLDNFQNAIVRGQDGRVNASETFRLLATSIDGITDPTQRAQAAQEVFGKSYGEIARLMSMSARDLKIALESTQDAEVFTPEERKQAEQYEKAVDRLSDAFVRIQNELGKGLVPILADVTEGFLDIFEAAEKAEVAGYSLGDALSDSFQSFLRATGLEAVRNFGAFNRMQEESAELARLGGLSLDQAAQYTDYYASRLDAATASSVNLTKALRTVDNAVSDLRGEISDREAFRKFDETMWYIGNTFNMSQQQADEFRLAILDVIDEIDNIPDSTEARIIAAVEMGDFLTVKALLDEFRRGVDVPIRQSPTNRGLPVVPRAMGGPVTGGSPYLVGERGPELFVPANSGRIVPNHAMGGDTINVTIQTSADPNEVARAIETYRRRNGALRI